MSENKKPRLCEVLGVEVDEPFAITGYGGEFYIDEDGGFRVAGDSQYYSTYLCALTDAINRLEAIKRKTRWAADDIADAKAVRRLWPDAWSVKYIGEYMVIHNSAGANIMYLDKKIFPSVQLGETVDLDVILEAEQ